METIELLERAWKNKEDGNIDKAWDDIQQALIQLRDSLAAQQGQGEEVNPLRECKECFGVGGYHSDNCSHLTARR